jgi:hypothetical protein
MSDFDCHAQCISSCPTGTYKQGICFGNTSTDSITCQPCQTCLVGQYISGSCTSGQTSDCTPCSNSCSAGEYITKRCDGRGVTDLQCAACITSCNSLWNIAQVFTSALMDYYMVTFLFSFCLFFSVKPTENQVNSNFFDKTN